jgi:hypothetical protein
MKIESYNNNRYIHVTDAPKTDFWWDNTLQQIVVKSVVNQLSLTKDSIVLQCATVCIGEPINCCGDSLLANNLDCLFDNNYDCIGSN